MAASGCGPHGDEAAPSTHRAAFSPPAAGAIPEELFPWLDTLRRIISSLGPQTPFQTSLTALLRSLSSRLGFLRVHLVLFEPETGLLRLSLADTPPPNVHANYAPGEGVTGQVFATGKPVIVERAHQHPLFKNLIFQRTQEELERLSFLSVPILSAPPGESGPGATEVIGTLNADTPYLSRQDLELRCLFLEVAASLIANEAAYMQEEMARQRRLGEAAAGFAPYMSVEERGTAIPPFVAQSKVMRLILEQTAHLAQGRGAILLRGEPGTGKGLLASRIHASSPRRDMPLVVYHCAATAPERQEADLRGHLKGAFPGASRTVKGLFEQATMGTVFLDAVDALSPEAQTALNHLLCNHTVWRMGAAEPLPVDVRVIASSAAPLEEAVEQGLFSAELLARLGHAVVQVPPLRERKEDVIPLAEYELQQASEKDATTIRRISYPALELLTRYYWPGNVPELKHCIARAIQNSEDQVIRAKDLPPSLQTAESSATGSSLSLGDAVTRYEKEILVDALIKAGGNMLQAARDLKTSYRIVNYKVKKYNIDPHHFTYRTR